MKQCMYSIIINVSSQNHTCINPKLDTGVHIHQELNEIQREQSEREVEEGIESKRERRRTCARCHHLWHGRAVPPRPQVMQAEVGAVVHQRQHEVKVQGSHGEEQGSRRGETLASGGGGGGPRGRDENQISMDWKVRHRAGRPENPTA